MSKILGWTAGDAVPHFEVESSVNPNFVFDSVGGRFVVLSFLGTSNNPKTAPALDFLQSNPKYFDGNHCACLAVFIDPNDRKQVEKKHNHIVYFWDKDRKVSTLYQALEPVPDSNDYSFAPYTLVLDPSLRVWACIPVNNPEEHNKRLKEVLDNLPAVNDHAGVSLHAPVLVVPRVFETSFCEQLIEFYKTSESYESGFMREANGKTVKVLDNAFKKRQDVMIKDDELCKAIQARVRRHLLPEIKKAFLYTPTNMERYLVACYDSKIGGFFRAHRDNTTKGTAHRQYACSINLTDDHEGGDLRFPEFGTKTYRAPKGGAVIFSCSLLHEATPVTQGTRYAFLPFFYDDVHAKIREQNREFLSETSYNRNLGENEYAIGNG